MNLVKQSYHIINLKPFKVKHPNKICCTVLQTISNKFIVKEHSIQKIQPFYSSTYVTIKVWNVLVAVVLVYSCISQQ